MNLNLLKEKGCLAEMIRKTVNKEICLNIGCGLSHGNGWVNVDGSFSLLLTKIALIGKPLAKIANFPRWPEETYYGDILSENLFPENSCTLIFSSHVLEHLSFVDAKLALRSFYKYLKPGGIIRIIVPDLEKCIINYIESLKDNDNNAANLLMEKLGIGMSVSRKSLITRLKAAFSNSKHQWMYDKYSLEALLIESEFSGPRLLNYGNWSDQRFAEVESEERHVNAICMEAYKLK